MSILTFLGDFASESHFGVVLLDRGEGKLSQVDVAGCSATLVVTVVRITGSN